MSDTLLRGAARVVPNLRCSHSRAHQRPVPLARSSVVVGSGATRVGARTTCWPPPAQAPYATGCGEAGAASPTAAGYRTPNSILTRCRGRRDRDRRRLVPAQLRDTPPRSPPVGPAEQPHGGRHQQQPHDGRVERDRHHGAEADHLHEGHTREREPGEHDDQQDRGRGDDAAAALQTRRDGVPGVAVRSHSSRMRASRNTSVVQRQAEEQCGDQEELVGLQLVRRRSRARRRGVRPGIPTPWRPGPPRSRSRSSPRP